MNQLRNAFICPICGMPMVHHRLRGYQCFNEEHNQIRQQKVAQAILRPDFDDSVTWCVGTEKTGFHAISDNQSRDLLCGSIIVAAERLEIDYRNPTCQRCMEVLKEQNSHIGE